MDLSNILGALVENLGANADRRIVSFSTDSDRLVLPVTPWKYQVQLGQNNKIVDILDFGEMVVFGNTKLHRLKFSCFFPSLEHEYTFLADDTYSPQECIAILNYWKTNQTPVRVIITESPVNERFAIMDLTLREKDGTRDIDYDIELVEYRDWNSPESDYARTVSSLTGLSTRSGVRSTAALQTFLNLGTKDVMDLTKLLTGGTSDLGSTVQVLGAVTGNKTLTQVGGLITNSKTYGTGEWLSVAGNLTGNQALTQVGGMVSTYTGLTALGLTNPVAAGVTLLASGGNPIKTVGNAAKGVLKTAGNLIKNPIQGVTGLVSGGCFITTAVCGSLGKADDCAELTAFRNFRDNWLAYQPDGRELVDEYYRVAPEIVRAIDARADSAEIYRAIWAEYLSPCYELIRRGRYAACRRKYVEMMRALEVRVI